MKTLIWIWLAAMMPGMALEAQEIVALRRERDDLEKRGLHRELVTLYQEKLMTVADDGSGEDLRMAVAALRDLNAMEEFDGLVEQAVASQPENPPLLRAAAMAYQGVPHAGRLLAGEFERSGRTLFRPGMVVRGGGRQPAAVAGASVFCEYRDFVRAMQLAVAAVEQSQRKGQEELDSWKAVATILRSRPAWAWQVLTPLEELPAWDEPGPEGGTEGAPWKGEGPVLYEAPDSWEGARNDGERWRFALSRQAQHSAEEKARATLELARFSASQFGTETLQSYGWWRQQDPEDAKGILELETLAEDETLARTSDGVRRFKLPPEHHFIALYRSVLEDRGVGGSAGDALVRVFLDRRQGDKARDVLREVIRLHGDSAGSFRESLLQQLTGNWGMFGPSQPVAAGTRVRLPLVFRNASGIQLTASPVDMEALLRDTIAYLQSNPESLDWQKLQLDRVATRLLGEEHDKYVGEPAVSWRASLTPRDRHRTTRAEVEVPVDQSGAFWITGRMEDGNEFHTLAWIVDHVVVQREVAGRMQWWVADAASGAPIEEADLSFIGYRVVQRERRQPGERNAEVRVREWQRRTDAEGKTLLRAGEWEPNFQWLAIARKAGKSPAFFGFRPYYLNGRREAEGTRDLSYGISDRPLYQPGDTVHLKFFLRQVGYFEPEEDRYAHQTGELVLADGRGEQAVKVENLKTDAWGGVEASVVIPAEGALGSWSATFQLPDQLSASLSFRVEEYRKPEYEVIVEAPKEPVKLGDTFTATVRANYFHGAPVRHAQVELIVKRNSLGERWFPAGRWDWLYGRGAWWQGEDASWHPGWERWGCLPPPPPWWGNARWTPEELVLKKTVAIGEDGTAEIAVDTSAAQQVHGDLDARYTIEARVVDASRREERGSGEVIAARKPFEVVVWTERGYTRPGDEVEATVSAATLAGKPVAGAKGRLLLYRLRTGAESRIEEEEAGSWEIETDEEGKVSHRFAAPAAGQYRLAARLAHGGGEETEGAVVLNVYGPGRSDPADWHFGPLELIADRATYQSGDTLRLRVNSDQPDAHVWLFLHIAGDSGREARMVTLQGKSTEIEVPLDGRDMPNMFVEGVAVFGAQVHTAVRQVLLPPEKKLIEVTLEPAKERVKPGEKSSLRVVLRDAEGKPVTGSAVITVYDKALEAITGGSNVGPIREHFWGWKNGYYGSIGSHSIPRASGNLQREGEKEMQLFWGDGTEVAPYALADGFSSRTSLSLQRKGAESSEMVAESVIDSIVPLAAAAPAAPDAAGGESIQVRKAFADLLKWSGKVEVGADGSVEIPLEFPDNLTTWKTRVWVLGKETRVGEGSAEIVASKELLVRLQAPRFLVERDEATFSAVVHNDHDAAKTVTLSLELEGGNLEKLDGEPQTVEIAARSEARIDWRVKAVREGEAVVRMKADAGDDGDAVERLLPVRVHGMLRQDAWSRTVEPESDRAEIAFSVPAERRVDQTRLTVRFSPTIAGAVVDAIPYLIDYPHGCTEQTLNRFVPTVAAQRMLRDLGINLAEVRAKRTNLNPQELGRASERAKQWSQWQRNPVFDEVEVEKMVAAGVQRLMTMQNADGGWGWFSGYGESSYPHTTAVVVHGLLQAKRDGAEVPDAMLQAGVSWLVAYERQQTEALQRHTENEALRKAGEKIKEPRLREKSRVEAIDALVRMVLGEAERDSEPMLAFLYRDRTVLPVYAKCLLGLEQHRKGDQARRDEVMRMIAQFLKRDEENQTAYLDLQNRGYWWFWYGSEVEAHAWYLKLLSAVQPQHPDTRGLVKYLVNHRRHASYWNSTRDTALAVEAIAGYFKASGETAPEMEVEVLLDGTSLRRVSIDRENLFSFDGTLVLQGEEIPAGEHRLELRRTGKGTLYANAYLEVFSLEDRLRAAGLEVKVERKVSKLVELEAETHVPDATGLVSTQAVERFRREPLADGATLASGDRIEVELIFESKNDYEYLLFSDAKAAGFEALDALSGYVMGDGLSAYREPREQTVDFFLRSLPRGRHVLRYQLRAEAPGVYKALPATAEAMYAPELRANSEDIRLKVE